MSRESQIDCKNDVISKLNVIDELSREIRTEINFLGNTVTRTQVGEAADRLKQLNDVAKNLDQTLLWCQTYV